MEEKSIEKAYEIQEINTKKWLAEGKSLIGRKIGLTSLSVQKQIGVDQPDFGMLFSDMAYESVEIVDFSRLIQPKAETEIAIVLKKDLKMEKNSASGLLASIDYVLPAVEIVASRIANWNISIFDTIADNASSGLFVLGNDPVKASDVDWELCGMSMFRKGKIVSTGAGMACLGNPLNAAVWLADRMVRHNRPLKAGDIILTGALGPMVDVSAGDELDVEINTVGKLHVQFST
ncbi:MAG: fumarylacetoacetate hydrolase family protein [Bacteroidetes bacterium]|nr:fumarylacetoacetate hydrolase family protein [Bacteroidota bacterium]